MANYTVSPYRCDIVGHIPVRAVHMDELTRCIALRECINEFRNQWFGILGQDQFDPGCSSDPMGSEDLTASKATELEFYVEFYDATITGKCRVIDANSEYMVLYPMWSLALLFRERLLVESNHETILHVRRGPAEFQPAVIYGCLQIERAARKLLTG